MPHFFSSLTYITYVGDRKKSCRKCTTTHSTLLYDYNIFCKYKKIRIFGEQFPMSCYFLFFSYTTLSGISFKNKCIYSTLEYGSHCHHHQYNDVCAPWHNIILCRAVNKNGMHIFPPYTTSTVTIEESGGV